MSELHPQNSVARFGVALVGPTFEWAYYEHDETSEEQIVLKTMRVRAHPGISFDEALAYTALNGRLRAEAILDQNKLRKQLVAIGETAEAQGDNASDDVDQFAGLQEETLRRERLRWDLVCQQVLMLTAPIDRERFGPLIANANPPDVRALREHLENVVLNRVADTVEAMTGVDPTSPPPSSS